MELRMNKTKMNIKQVGHVKRAIVAGKIET